MNSNKIYHTTKRQQAIWLKLMRLGKMCGCHQLQSRSFFYRNFQFPVCARCTGIIIGEFLLAPISLILGINNLLLNIIFLLIMALDGGLQYYKLLTSNNFRRLVTGLMGGYAIMLLTISLVTRIWYIIV